MNSILYETLGLTRDASPGDVRKAYRALARKNHPDRGGSAEEFQRVHDAYTVLSDAERRAKYDVTGEVDTPKPDRTIGEIMSILSPVLFAVLKDIVKQGGKVKEEDVVHHMRTALVQGRKGLEANVKALNADKVMLAAVGERFEIEGEEPNLLAFATREHRQNLSEKIEEVTRELDRVGKAIEFLKKCRYKMDPKLVTEMKFGFFKMSGSATSIW